MQFLHTPTNLIVTGAIDDLWQNSAGDYLVVDYKATSKQGRITALDQDWHAGYKRQMEIYQWLIRRNGYAVSDTGYFVYCNGYRDRAAFDGKLEFDVTLIAHEGDDTWVEDTIERAHACLSADTIPAAGADCDFCAYVEEAVGEVVAADGRPMRLEVVWIIETPGPPTLVTAYPARGVTS